ncbi:RNA polymerase sigma factor [Pedobacter insulae]|uniref:RNA polymerase sigma-70 factor, ECF subfamily n=1 Tax=Pedobacter insulae TaxID=414048 RepID=A0A1I2ZQI4_9SPHI|nr:RNA polymerase sigma-70 factor [Pedobacter insulae]SFH39885.1 RNA polymerase sigma-70 factor, ECF subfamily [Pedobacter insulae]
MRNEKALLKGISCGDETQFRELFNSYREKVYSYAFKILKSESEAEDVLQDVFLKLWLHDELDEIDNFEGYLKAMTRNHVFKVLRRQNLKCATNNLLKIKWTESHNETEELVLLNDSQLIINRALNEMPPKQKLVYNLCKSDGLKYDAVAKRLAISPLTVKTHMQHSLRFLRSYLTKHTDIAVFLLIIENLIRINK